MAVYWRDMQTEHGIFKSLDDLHVDSEGIHTNGLNFGNIIPTNRVDNKEICQAQIDYDAGTIAIEAIKNQQKKIRVLLKKAHCFRTNSEYKRK